MDRMIYLAMSGAAQLQHNLASTAHNLANVDTVGFRADFDTLVNTPVYGPGHPSRVYVSDERSGIDLSGGQLIESGRPLDVAVNGEGFIEIQAFDGTPAYTRAGDLRVGAGGLLQTGTGYTVMGNDGPIAIPPFDELEVGTDGTISIRPLGQGAATLAVVDRIKLVNPQSEDVFKDSEGLLRVRGEAPADAAVTIVSGAVEASNVNAVEAMVNMIELSRQFEMHIKLMSKAEDNDTAAARLLRLSS